MNILPKGFKNRFEQAEERMSEQRISRTMKIIESEEQKEKD